MRRRRRLGLGRLRLQAQQFEELRHAMEGAVGQVLNVDAVEVVDEVAGDDPQENPLEGLQRVRRAVEIPHGRRRAETHGHVEPRGDAVGAGEKCARVCRITHRPLAVRVHEVAPEDAYRRDRRDPDDLHQPPDHVHVIVDEVVGRHVVCPGRRVVSRPPPIFAAAYLVVPGLVGLDYGERRRRKVLAGGRRHQSVHARPV